ncbi:MAG: cobalamin biosynthesis protein CbiD [Oscillospiraceae bacterium]|nr:cobalamin biosynthesis protein CbiD [Oscillospiraceae bacterium]
MRLGYTTGSCAAAAARAAALLLLTGHRAESVALPTPAGRLLTLDILHLTGDENAASCAVRKDAGDDPDVTAGALIFARVAYADGAGIEIDGGEGVGRVTKPGLDQPVGAAAINSVPRRMIRENVAEVCRESGYRGALRVVISVPGGAAIAEMTFNARLGIVGGISILGTTGIVKPMSEQALVDTIRVELRQKRALGADYALLTPGNYGADFLRDRMGIDPARAVLVSNYIGDALDICREEGFRGALLAGHIGKLVKLAGGMLNTHSKYGDCRMELLAAHAGAAGLPAEKIAEILRCVSCDEALRVLDGAGLREDVLARIAVRIEGTLSRRAGAALPVGAIVFSNQLGFLTQTAGAQGLLRHFREN